MPELFNSPLAVVDVETTGMSHKNGGVIDIGILRIENGQVVQTMRQLINPGSQLPAFITNLTGIKNEDVEQAPTFPDIATDVYEILEDCIFIAHNVRFDYAFIKEEFLRAGYQYRPRQLCTVRLSKSLYPQHRSHKLDALIERFDISIKDRHRAFADAQATWQALQIMATQHPEKHFDQIVRHQLRQPTIPNNVPPETIQSLPEVPGVYIFEADNGATLYVGKSINIRSRVLSHFSDDHRSVKELRMAQEMTNIRYIPTHGELGALLMESQLIKELTPIHNRMLRRQTDMVLAIMGENINGYPTIRIERHAMIANGKQDIESCNKQTEKTPTSDLRPPASQPAPMEQVMGVYRSERQAKESLIALAKEYHLCHKLLGLQKTTGACFQHQLKHCYGACVGKESNLEYQLRFSQAFASSRIAHWPFSTPVIITESTKENSSISFIIDQWCLVGTITQQDQDIQYQEVIPSFDLDQYKIFRRFLQHAKNRQIIKPYSGELHEASFRL